jgi:RNA polymerase sigma factor (sigma-70 family)
MATDMSAEMAAAGDRWEHMWSHREHLLKVARRRSVSQEDAEDAVHEAMLRAAERPDLDDERLAAWLTTVTMRLCVDRYRQVNREAEVHTRPTLHAPGPVTVEEAVCDRAEARWLAVRSGELPARQAEALWLKSEDLDVGQVAVKMGLSYRTVESLLARARRTLRNSLAATLGFALFLIGWGRPRGTGRAHAVAAASTAATLAVAGFVLPYALDSDGSGPAPAPRPPASHAPEALRPDGSAGGSGAQRPGEPPATAPDRETTAPGDDGPLFPLSVPPLPEVPVTALPTVAAPQVPQLPSVPALPQVTDLPDVEDGPTTPELPLGSAAPSASLPGSTPATLPQTP